MKKLLALVLALIMVLGLGVTAFAANTVNIIKLDEEDEDKDEPKVIKVLDADYKAEKKDTYLCGPDGGDFYFEIDKYNELKNITVSATGNVTAEIVEFDGEELTYDDENVKYGIWDSEGNDGKGCFQQTKWINDEVPGLIPPDGHASYPSNTEDAWDTLQKVADALNDKFKVKDRFTVEAYTGSVNADGRVAKDKHLLKVTVAENYSAAYKEGTVKLTATRKADKKAVVAEFTIISDVTIFEYEEVKWAADNKALVIYDDGYSDYETAKLGYGEKYDEGKLRKYPGATVVSTTAFRAIEGEELVLESNDVVAANKPLLTVTIDEVAKGQKGVNFDYDTLTYYDEDGEELETLADQKGNVEYFEFGFLGDQVIASDFEIEVKLGYDYYDLREKFGKKVEEEDIITYYVLKDGVKIDEFTVDYKDDDIGDDVELEILGKAGDKLGYYTVTLDAPAAEEGEENPNTGAESVVGVVAAMAVISLATAAAVSLKK